MIDDLTRRLQDLDDEDVVLAAARELDALDADRRRALRRELTDPIIGLVGAQLVELVTGPMPVAAGVVAAARSAHPSQRSRRDPVRKACDRCFEEGYAFGRIVLDTQHLALLHSPLSTLDAAALRTGGDATSDAASAAGYARLRALRSRVLRAETSEAFVRTAHLAPYLRTQLMAEERIPADMRFQLGAIGFVTALCEWSMVLGEADAV